MHERVIELQSSLAIEPAVAWARATSLDGIRAELPWPLRLTTEPAVESLEQFVAVGRVLATLRLGPIPILRWHPGIVELGDRHFVEESGDMTFMRSWRHLRRIHDEPGGGIRIHDGVTFSSRVPGAHLFVGWLFRRRHAALRRTG